MTTKQLIRMKCTAEEFGEITVFTNYLIENEIKLIQAKHLIKSKNYDLDEPESYNIQRVIWEFSTDKTLKEVRRIMKEYYQKDGTYPRRMMHQTLNYRDDHSSGDESM